MRFSAIIILISFRRVCYQAMAQSTCMFALLGCPGGFASDNCVQQYYKYDCAPKCCALSTLSEIRSCLGDSTPTPTDKNSVACGTAIRIISACQTIIPTFSAASTAELETCPCYEKDGTFYPQPFDDGVSACDSYFATAQPTLVPVVKSYLGFCTSNQLVASMSAASVSTSPPSVSLSKSMLSTSKNQATASATSSLAAASTQTTVPSPASTASKSSSSRLHISSTEVLIGIYLSLTLLLRSIF